MTLNLSGSTGVSGVDGSAGTPAFQGADSNTGISFGTDVIIGSTGGSERLRIDASGRVGIGTTSPGEVLTVSKSQGSNAFPLHIENSVDFGWGVGLKLRQALASGGSIIDSGAILSDWQSTDNSTLEFYNCTSGSLTEKARIDSSGRLLVGTSSSRGGWFNTSGQDPLIQTETTTQDVFSGVQNSNSALAPWILLGKSRGATAGAVTVVQNGDPLGGITFQGADGTQMVEGARIQAYVDGTPGADDLPTRLEFSTTADGASSPTERMRIDSIGDINTFVTGGTGIQSRSSIGPSTGNSVFGGFHSATNTTNGSVSFIVYTNGNVQNTNNSYTGFSDIKLKENIVDAASQWSDIKALRVRKYNFKEETGNETHTQIGLIAQEVELVSPGLVTESPDRDEDGNQTGEVTKGVNYSVLYMKAVKALQEAMERIEQLETEMAAVKAQLS